MHNSRLGCLTPAGLISAGITVVIIVVITFIQGGVVFNPGALNAIPGALIGGYASHAEFTGQCKLCHAPFWDLAGMATRCDACHTGIIEQVDNPATLHGAFLQRNQSLNCRDCHPEHRGPTAALTDFHGTGFPHDVLGYSLNGHAKTIAGLPFLCADCHPMNVTTFDLAMCETCHAQIDFTFTSAHILSFGNTCLACHDGIDTYGSDFDHNRFFFNLDGKHGSLPCSACHINTRSISDLQSAPTDCNSCHAPDDVHQSNLGPGCASCHIPDSWSQVTFDHNLTAFKLLEKHAGLDCESCHIDKSFTNTPTECNACHAPDDVHQGTLGQNCQDCHTTAGWSPAAFDHNLAVFKLLGKHIGLACESCHLNKLYKNTPSDCYSCHFADDIHQGQFGTGCDTCHSPSGWKPAAFDHNLATFILSGKHIGVACESCHVAGVLRGAPSDCFSCHSGDDAHQGRFGTRCDTCHSPAGWKPTLFDHNVSAFKLDGKHLTVDCEGCHKSVTFKGTPTDCYSCHAVDDHHQGQFGTACNACHTTSGWLPATFNHSLSNFPLTGAHLNVACTRCHINSVFRGTPTACVSCHTDPPFHVGLFGTLCSQCHTTSAWIPATFNLGHSFPIHHGNATTCRNCHTTSLSTWTCFACHDQSEMQKKHAEKGISNFSNCLECHPTGKGDEPWWKVK